mgnify:FL=1
MNKVTPEILELKNSNSSAPGIVAPGNNKKKTEITVFECFRETKCSECDETIHINELFSRQSDNNVCLSCFDLDHLVFLPSRDSALSRRSKKYSTLSAIVFRYSKSRKRNERIGQLVEGNALIKAEEECLGDAEVRQKRQGRDKRRRDKIDKEFVENFAIEIRKLFPNAPLNVETEIAEHACLKHSGRVGRIASAKEFNEEAINLSVRAYVRHNETNYDSLLSQGYERYNARNEVKNKIEEVLSSWS